MPKQPERLYQLRFDAHFRVAPPQDITPEGFTGLDVPLRKQREQQHSLARFIREVKDGLSVTSPAEAAQYLLERVYTPFEAFDQEEMWVLLLRAYPNNPAARKAIKAQAKCKKAM